MGTIQRIGDLEIDQDLPLQQREWRAQRVGWVVMLLVVVAAIAGVFGSLGPLADAVAGADDERIQVQYGRFERFKAPTTLRIRLSDRAVTDSTVRLWIDRAFLSGLLIEHISPQPTSTRAGMDRLLYTFETEGAGEPLEVVVDATTQQVGLLRGEVGLAGGPSVRFHQFVYP